MLPPDPKIGKELGPVPVLVDIPVQEEDGLLLRLDNSQGVPEAFFSQDEVEIAPMVPVQQTAPVEMIGLELVPFFVRGEDHRDVGH